jgi:23S rRNA (uracil1939-C5)-methyltransferase
MDQIKPSVPAQWRQGEFVEIEISDISDTGMGVGRFEGRVVFVPDAVTGDQVRVRLVRVKPQYATGKLDQVIEPSQHRIRPQCIVADKCGGCQWQHISDDYQLYAKQQQVIQALERIGEFSQPAVDPVLSMGLPAGYRNKATYPVKLSATRQVQAGYYQKSSHRLVNLNRCPVQDERLNPFLAEIKQDIQQQGWPIYDETTHHGKIRHISVRVGRRTGEILLTLVSRSPDLPKLQEQAQIWLERYPSLVGVCLNINRAKGNVIFGAETNTIAGRSECLEGFAGLEFKLRADTFFQVNTEAAEALLNVVMDELKLQGTEVLLDAYCGIGTFTLPLAQQVKQAIGIEVHPASVTQAQENAQLNDITNIEFQIGTVETILPQLEITPDLVLLDPPRKGCDRVVLETLIQMQPAKIVYISCKPTTLARDLKFLCQTGGYQLTRVQPADFFPQTSHVECAAFLVR